MTALLIAHLEITNPDGFQRYRELVPDIIAKFGGRYLVRGGAVEVLEGEWPVPRLVVLEFETLAAVKRFYHSEAYQEILPLRLANTKGTVVVVDGQPATA